MLLLVDFIVGFVDTAMFGGVEIEAAAQRSRELLTFAREAGLPVAHSRVGYANDSSDVGLFAAPGWRPPTSAGSRSAP